MVHAIDVTKWKRNRELSSSEKKEGKKGLKDRQSQCRRANYLKQETQLCSVPFLSLDMLHHEWRDNIHCILETRSNRSLHYVCTRIFGFHMSIYTM